MTNSKSKVVAVLEYLADSVHTGVRVVAKDALPIARAQEEVIEAARMHTCMKNFEGGQCDICAALAKLGEVNRG